MVDAIISRRLGFVVPSFDKGGLEQVVYNLFKAAQEAGHDVTLFVEAGNKGEFASCLNEEDIVFLNGDRQLFFRELMARRIQALHFNYSVFCLEEAQQLGIGCVYCIHNIYTWLDDPSFEVRAKQMACADHLVAVSSFVANYVQERSGIPAEFIQAIPNGIAVDQIDAIKASTKPLDGVPSQTFVFGMLASFHRVKMQKSLIGAAEQLQREGLAFSIALLGNVGDPEFYAEFEQALSLSSAKDHFAVLGHVPHEDAIAHLKGAIDCALLTTLQEGASNTSLEAIACGVPLILTNTGFADELADNFPDLATVIPAHLHWSEITPQSTIDMSQKTELPNQSELVMAMRTAIEKHDNDLQSRLKRHTPNRFDFTVEKMADQHLALLEKTVKLT